MVLMCFMMILIHTLYIEIQICLNPPFTCDSLFIHLPFILGNYDYLVGLYHLYYSCILCICFESLLSHCWIFSIPYQYPICQTGLHQLLSVFTAITFSILVISSLTNPGSCDQDPIILMFSIHDFCDYLTVIFSLVMGDDIIPYSGILDIFPSSIHEIPEFSLCDPLHVTRKICLRSVPCRDF